LLDLNIRILDDLIIKTIDLKRLNFAVNNHELP
jgi:hypothetical protein